VRGAVRLGSLMNKHRESLRSVSAIDEYSRDSSEGSLCAPESMSNERGSLVEADSRERIREENSRPPSDPS